MASFASLSPPFEYNPSGKPTKSILKHNVPLARSSSSWLSRLSSAAPSSEPGTPQASRSQQRSLGLFRKLIATPSPLSPDSAQPPSVLSAQEHGSAVTIEDNLQRHELKRVRFPVDQLKTEYYPYKNADEPIDEPITTEQNDTNTNRSSPDPSTQTEDTPTSPRDLITLYRAACKNKEEPVLEGLITALTAQQYDTHAKQLDLSTLYLTRRSAEPLADILCLDFGLEALALDHCELEDDAIKVILHSLLLNDTTQKLSLVNNKKLKTNGFKYIAIYVKSSACLKVLDLSFTYPDKKAVQHLVQAIMPCLSAPTPSLQKLILDGCALKPAMLEILAKGIRKSTCLQDVSLRNNRITHQGAEWIGVMLVDYNDSELATGLQSLALDSNEIRQGVSYIAQALRRNRNLRYLSMRDCKLDSNGCNLIGEALKYNQGLKTLDISHNSLHALAMEGINTLKQALYVNRSLTELCLTATGLDSEAAVALAECLSENTCLVRLDLSENLAIDLAGALALVASVKNNSTLTFVGISVPPKDRDMARCQSDMIAICARNELAKYQEGQNTPPAMSSEAEMMTTRTQATAHLTLQERLAAVTRSASQSRSHSVRPSIITTDTVSAGDRRSRKRRDTELFDSVTTQSNLLNDMLSAVAEQHESSNTIGPPDDTIMQVYHQCLEAHAIIGLKVDSASDEGQLALLLGLNDHLITILAKYDQLYPAPTSVDEQPPSSPAVAASELPLSSSFEIGDDDDDEDMVTPLDKHSSSSSSVDIHELRREKELEEGAMFKHAKEVEHIKETEQAAETGQ